MDTLTNDSLELEINNKMGELLQVWDTIQFTMIISSYSWERQFYTQAQDEPGSMANETESEIKKWYFDRSNRLRAFSSEFESDYPLRKSSIYLFSDDSLIAIGEWVVDDSEVTVTDRIRMVASQCPNCGVATRGGHNETGDIKYLSEADIVSKQTEFDKSMSLLISTLKTGRKKASEDGDDLIFTVNKSKEGNTEDKSEAITYTEEFRVAKNLYPNFIMTQ